MGECSGTHGKGCEAYWSLDAVLGSRVVSVEVFHSVRLLVVYAHRDRFKPAHLVIGDSKATLTCDLRKLSTEEEGTAILWSGVSFIAPRS